MPRSANSDISITGKSPFSAKNGAEKDAEKCLARVPRLSLGVSVQEVTCAKDAEKPRFKLPVLTKTRKANSLFEDRNDLQVLLRVQCLDFPLQVHGMKPEWNKSHTSSTACTGLEVSPGKDQDKVRNEEGPKQTNNVLPISSSTVLQGRRVNLRGKGDSIKQRKQQGKIAPREENNLPLNTDSMYIHQEPDIEKAKPLNMISFSLNSEQQLFQTPRTTNKFQISNKRHVTLRKSADRKDKLSYHMDARSNIISSLVPVRHGERPTFHLAKADKYDINPRNIVEVKVCSVFKGNALKTMIIYPGYNNNNWMPCRDRGVIKNAVYKAIMQQPAMFLRQPSHDANMGRILKEHESSIAKANITSQPANTEVTREVKKFVVRLPPIC